MTGQLTDTEINNVLSSQVMGRLACADNKKPYIVPVTYMYNGKYIYGQTNEGLKLKILRKNPNVCFEVEVMTDMRNWKSVVIFGKFEELKNRKANKAKKILFEGIFSLMTGCTVHTHEHEVKTKPDDSSRVKHILYRIRIRKISSRFEKQ